MVSFTGRCLAHRAGIMQLHGAWRDALAEAQLARERCEQAMNRAATGQALYQQGELHRLLGDSKRPRRRTGRRVGSGASRSRGSRCCGWRKAMSTPRRRRSAALSARRPSLCHACGSAARIRRDHARRRRGRRGPRALPASSRRSRRQRRPMLEAIAAHVRGAVELARRRCSGRARRRCVARGRCGRSSTRRTRLARVRVLVGLACRALGDERQRRAGARRGAQRLRAARCRAGSRPRLDSLPSAAA